MGDAHRICIKGIPSHCNEVDVRRYVVDICKISLGDITDTAVLRKPDGNSRQFGFVGLRTIEVGERVLKALEGTMWESKKVKVEVAKTSAETQSSLSRCPSRRSRTKAARIKLDGGLDKRVEARKRNRTEPSPDLVDSVCRVFVKNLPPAATEDDIRKHFTQFGTVEEIDSWGVGGASDSKSAIVAFDSVEAVGKASAESQQQMQGRRIGVVPARETEGLNCGTQVGGATSSFKRRKAAAREADSKNIKSWNLLYVSSEQAIEATARRLNVPTEAIMDMSSGDSLAARAALAESMVVRQTKEWLAKLGLDEQIFVGYGDRPIKAAQGGLVRWKPEYDTILLKNLPPKVTEKILSNIFGSFGEMALCELSPSETCALIRYTNPKYAKKAFESSSHRAVFKPLSERPILLEYLPASSFTGADESLFKKQEEPTTQEAETKTPTEEQYVKLLIKNLDFQATEKDLRKMFDNESAGFSLAPERRPIRLPTKPGGGIRGFAFITMATSSGAEKAMDALKDTHLYGRKLVIEIAER